MKRWQSWLIALVGFAVTAFLIETVTDKRLPIAIVWGVGLIVAAVSYALARRKGLPLLPVLGDSDLRPGQHQLSFDSSGLPVFTWRESHMAKVRWCGIKRGEDGGLNFQFSNPNDIHPQMQRQLEQGGMGVAKMLIDGFQGRIEASRSLSAPWAALESFIVTNEDHHFGHSRKSDDGRELPSRNLLLARFAVGMKPIELSTGFFTPEALDTMHGILTREFIDRRGEHLNRLKGIERSGARSGQELPVQGGRIPPDELSKMELIPEAPQPLDAARRYEIALTMGEKPNIYALLLLKSLAGDVVEQDVTFEISNENGVPTLFVIGKGMSEPMPGPTDFYVQAPVSRIAGVALKSAASWHDVRFKEFVFEPGEHLLLLTIDGTDQQELIARSGIAPIEELEKLGTLISQEIEKAKGSLVPSRRKVI